MLQIGELVDEGGVWPEPHCVGGSARVLISPVRCIAFWASCASPAETPGARPVQTVTRDLVWLFFDAEAIK
jgi:hypothetical protein